MKHIEIRVKEQIDERWSDWLDGLTITHIEEDESLLTGLILDQSALYGLLSKLRDLGLSLSAVNVGEEIPPKTRNQPLNLWKIDDTLPGRVVYWGQN